MRSRALLVSAVFLAALIALSFLERDAVLTLGMKALVRTFGYQVRAVTPRLGSRTLTLEHLAVDNAKGEQVFSADKIEIGFSLRDLLPGGDRAAGVRFIDVRRPMVTIIHHPDGSYNVTAPNTRSSAPAGAPPWKMRVRVSDGTVVLLDRYIIPGKEQSERFVEIWCDARLSPAAPSRYAAGFIVEAGGRRYPVWGRGALPVPGAFALQRWHADAFPIASLLNFTLQSRMVRLGGGQLRGLDARYAVFSEQGKTPHAFVCVAGFLDDGILHARQLAAPIEEIHGPLHACDDEVETPGLDARFSGGALHVVGGVYGVKKKPLVRMLVAVGGELALLRRGAVAAREQPITGSSSSALFVEGAADNPLTIVRMQVPVLRYAQIRLAETHALIALRGTQGTLLSAGAGYEGANAHARGAVELRDHGALRLIGDAHVDSDQFPALAAMMPHQRLAAAMLLNGTSDRPALGGIVVGDGSGGAFRAAFRLRPDGIGTVNPFLLRRSDGGMLAGTAVFDRSKRQGLAVLDASNLRAFGAVTARAHAILGMDGDTFRLYGAQARIADGVVTLRGSANAAGFMRLAATAEGIDLAALRGLRLPLRQGRFYGQAGMSGTSRSPRGTANGLLVGGRYEYQGRRLPVDADASLAYADREATVDAAALIPGAYGMVSGSVKGVAPAGNLAPRMALHARVVGGQASVIAASAGLHLPVPLEASFDAQADALGPIASPSLRANVHVPEGEVNGLRFQGGIASLSGRLGEMSVRRGEIGVGGTRIAFSGDVGTRSQTLSLRSARLDFRDFNDFFDQGDMLGGRGWAAVSVARSGNAVRAYGDLVSAGTRLRGFSVGDVRVKMRPSLRGTQASAVILGEEGELRAAGHWGVFATDPVAFDADIARLDVGTWLPAAGIVTPVSGDVDGRLSVRGTLRAPALGLHAALHNAFVNRMAVRALTLDATADRHIIRLTRAGLTTASFNATASGAFEPVPGGRLDVRLNAESPDIAAAATSFMGLKKSASPESFSGRFSGDAHVSGTQRLPTVQAKGALFDVRVGHITVPRVFVAAHGDTRMLSLDRGEIDFTKGMLLADAQAPLEQFFAYTSGRRLNASAFRKTAPRLPDVHLIDPRRAFHASLTADAIDMAPFAAAIGSDVKLSGMVDGRILAFGTVTDPRLSGRLTLRDGRYSSALLRSPIDKVNMIVDLPNTRDVRLTSFHLEAGGGSLDGSADASIGDLRDPATLDISASAQAHHLRIDAPKYLRGTIDGTATLTRAPHSTASLSGALAFEKTRIPLSAVMPASSGTSPPNAMPDVAFNMSVAAGNDVRVQSAAVDVGVRGDALLGGTLASPTLSGGFRATGGTVSFYQMFTLQSGVVRFSPENGVIPFVNATATTHVQNPDTDILLHVTGLASNLTVDFASNPLYDRAEILALLAGGQTLGLVRTNGASSSQPSLFQSAATGYINQQFTRSLLEPLQSALGQSLGLRDLQLNAGLGGAYGLSASKALGRKLTASFAESYGLTQRQSVGLAERLNAGSSVQLTFFSASSAAQTTLTNGLPFDPTKPTDLTLLSLIPPAGTKGFTLTYQRRFH